MNKQPKCPECYLPMKYIHKNKSVAFPKSEPFYRIVCHHCDYWSNAHFILIDEKELNRLRKESED